ncbi:DNA-binding protein, partial [Phocaeicola vulgatus]
RAAFTPVATRIAQAATLKAEKAGKGTVDLDAAKGKTPASTNENNPSL